MSRSFFDNIDNWAKEQGASSRLAHFTIEKNKQITAKDLLENFYVSSLKEIMKNCNAEVEIVKLCFKK